MKKGIFLGALLIVSIFNLNAWGMEPEEDDVAKVTRLLREVEERVDGNYEEGTAFLGNTDAGKSALFNYLQGVILHGRLKGFGKYEIIFARDIDARRYSPIGNQNTISQTTFPVAIENNFDCPGFKDTRPFQDIVNAYSIYRVVKQTKKLKILLVSSFGELDITRTTLFMDLLDQVGEIFQHNIEALCRGLCLVVTKTNRDQVNRDEYRALFSRMLREQLDAGAHQDNPRIRILNFLSQTDRIAFFKMPEQEGPIPNDDRRTISDMIAAIPSQANIRPELSLSDRSKLSLDELLSGMFKKMRDTLTDLSNNYSKLYARFIKSHLNQNAGQLRRAFGEVTRHSRVVSDEPDKFYESAENVNEILKFLSHEDQKIFEGTLARLSFFEKVGLGRTINHEIREYRIFSSLAGFTRDAEDYVANPVTTYPVIKLKDKEGIERDGVIARITGGLLGSSDIPNIPEEVLKKGRLSEIALHSSRALLIDEDLAAPGVNLILMASDWWVVGNKMISLKGDDGLVHNNPKANDGKDGLPGKPGGSGGHFYGKGKVFEGLENLIIDVSGGKGGPGQNGGDGTEGAGDNHLEDSSVPRLTPLEVLQEESTPIGTKIRQGLKMVFTFNSEFTEQHNFSNKGGAGGAAGEGGEAGSFEGANGAKIVAKKGEPGASGRKGKNYVSKIIEINDHMLANRLLFDSNAPVPAKVVAAITLPIRAPIAFLAYPISKFISWSVVANVEEFESQSASQSQAEKSVEAPEFQFQDEESVEKYEPQPQDEENNLRVRKILKK
jgi:hypothetical protein